jgi:6-pyruvoyltetrahydropterin/6-carboxytetrahydropterin synthase
MKKPTMRFTITKSFRFEAAHSLPFLCEGHQCKRVHGHSYEVIVGVSGPLTENHWVQDYADVSAAVSPLVKSLDHQFLNDMFGDEPTTAERLAQWFWDELLIPLPLLSRIEVRETPTSNVILSNE